jgi:serine/threonine protein kinase
MSGDRDGDRAQSPVSVGDLLLGRYRIADRMAEGGHSLIYRLEDERLRRPACAKVFHLRDPDPGVRQIVEKRFVQEAFLLARLAHPGLVQIYDFGYLAAGRTTPECPFQICELVTGGPLSRWVKRRGHLGPREVLATMMPLCRALADVHAARLVHLDVKPQNVLLARTATGPVPKLADFGIAQSLDSPPKDGAGAGSLLMYSVNWAAPEQMVGDPVDSTSDLYSLALVAIFALTGRLVFQEKDPGQAYRMRKYSGDVLGNAIDGCGLGDDLVNLFLRACSFHPGDRIDDAAEFARLLQAAMAPLVASSGTPTVSPADDSGPQATSESTASDRSLPGKVTAASLWPLSVDRPVPDIAGRHVAFQALQPAVELGAENGARVRVSFVPSSAERPALHIKGVNCFVTVAGRRPSSALTLEVPAAVDLLSPRGERLAGVDVSFATAGPSKNILTLGGQCLVVPADECGQLVALDFGVGRTCALVYEKRRP